MFERYLKLIDIINEKSHFLIGPRQTGKSSLCRASFPDAKYIDLLEADTFRSLSAHPEKLRHSLSREDKVIVIDEIQKCPGLLDEVQLMLDRNKNLRFVLTGSSARKLKRGSANLLPGRVWNQRFFPLVHSEVPHTLMQKRLTFGGLPGVLLANQPHRELEHYVGSYLQEEIQAEGLVRNIGGFARFLEVAGQMNCEQINFTTVSNQSSVPLRTVRDYFQILEDTQIATLLPVFDRTSIRKPVAVPKCYFFDIGVANSLRKQTQIDASSIETGKRWEHLVYCELIAYLSYNRIDTSVSYWRTRTQLEVDFIVGDFLAIEVKHSEFVRKSDIKGLLALREEFPNMRSLVVCNESIRRHDLGVEFVSLIEFLEELWAGKIF